MSELTGKTVLITGGANGIGEATADLFAERGATVVIADLAMERAHEVARRIGNDSFAIELNVADPAAWKEGLETVASRRGGLDILILNAGVMMRPAGSPIMNDPVPYMDTRNFDKVVAVNIAGVYHGIVAAVPHMTGRPGATILATASGAGVAPYPGDPVYAMSKYAVVGLASSLAPALDGRGIRILTICPNGIETTMCPPDLFDKKVAENSFSTPRFMAEAMLEVYGTGKAGEVWMGGAKRAPYRYEPTPIAAH